MRFAESYGFEHHIWVTPNDVVAFAFFGPGRMSVRGDRTRINDGNKVLFERYFRQSFEAEGDQFHMRMFFVPEYAEGCQAIVTERLIVDDEELVFRFIVHLDGCQQDVDQWIFDEAFLEDRSDEYSHEYTQGSEEEHYSDASGETECEVYTLYMYDSYGDGWDGAFFEIDGVRGTVEDGYQGTVELCLTQGCHDFSVSAGDYPHEISWELAGYTGEAPFDGRICVGECEVYGDYYEVHMSDTYSDTWDGAYMTIAG